MFQARCEARAILFASGELDLSEAVDVLQAAAVATGLVAELGQDAVQAIMSDSFGKIRRHVRRRPGWSGIQATGGLSRA